MSINEVLKNNINDLQYPSNEYKGLAQSEIPVFPYKHKDCPSKYVPYHPSNDLIEAVNLAFFLKRPLLLEGEAGCGKSQLAQAIAYELGLPYYSWPIKSTTKSSEGLYEYDSLLRLYDVQIHKELGRKSIRSRNPQNVKNYVKFGPLGSAFKQTDYPAVILIDEIDKADIDFANDLLTILDEPWGFYIHETNEWVKIEDKKLIPLVIVTSNKEKGSLPIPFLRRCLYHYMQFPDTVDKLMKIVNMHYPNMNKNDSDFSEIVASKFLQIRDKGLLKKPGTSEFLDWLNILINYDDGIGRNKVEKGGTDIPYRHSILKMHLDYLNQNSMPDNI